MSQQHEQYNTLDENVNIVQLHEILSPLRATWYMFGLHLRVPVAELEGIQRDRRADERLLEVIIWWLRNNPRPTWPAVVDALLSAHRQDIARRVNRDYCPGYIPHQDRPSQVSKRSGKVGLCMVFCTLVTARPCKLRAFCIGLRTCIFKPIQNAPATGLI